MRSLILLLILVVPVLSYGQLTKLDNVSTKIYTGADDPNQMYCAHCASSLWASQLADNAKEQIGKYNGYDSNEYKLSKWGEHVKGVGCCIDVLLRAWDSLDSVYRYNNLSDEHWKSEIEKLGITHMGLDYIYYRWRTQNGADLTQWEKDGGRNLAHRRCRNIIKLFQKKVIPCERIENYKAFDSGIIVFFKQSNGNIWHVGIVDYKDSNLYLIHNIGGGVVEIPMEDLITSNDVVEGYKINDLNKNLYNFKAK